MTDVDGNAVTFSYTSDVLASVQDNFANSIAFTYVNDSLDHIQDHAGRTVSFTYVDDELRTVNDVANEDWQFQYDANGRLSKRLDPLLNTIKDVVYDEFGRVQTQTWPRDTGSGTEQYFYSDYATHVLDPLTNENITFFDARSRTSASKNALGQTTKRAYDGQSRIVEVFDAANQSSSQVFDANNNVQTATNALQETTTFEYDTELRPFRITDPLGHISETAYDAEHHPETATIYPAQGDAITVATTYYPNGQIKTVTDAKGAESTLTYDAKANPDTSSTSYLDEQSQTITTPVVDRDFDTLGRLVKLTDQEGAVTVFTYNNRAVSKPSQIQPTNPPH